MVQNFRKSGILLHMRTAVCPITNAKKIVCHVTSTVTAECISVFLHQWYFYSEGNGETHRTIELQSCD
jgi:hypothetical protein